MIKPMVRTHDTETDQIIEREMNDQEFADHEAKLIELNAEKLAKEAKATERTALLAKLGISEDEAKLLLS
jgi:hypothetical protein